MEEAMAQFMAKVDARLQDHDIARKNQENNMRSIERTVGQLAKFLSERPQGSLPSTTENNPKEQVQAITLRSGRELNQQEKEQDSEKEEQTVRAAAPTSKDEASIPVPSQTMTNSGNPPVSSSHTSPYVTPIPFPQRLQKNKLDKQFTKFLDVFRKLQINIPFADALEQMPSYVKFMKEILSNKRKLGEYETVMLTEECTAILQNKLPPKLKDPGSFTIPCTIGNSYFDKALCDLGASINLMPFSIFKKLGLGEIKATTISLQLADQSIKRPRGIVEDVLVKVDKFIFPVDFIVLDMEEEDREIPLLLGRPFLATGRTIIDVQQGKLILRV